MTDRTIVLFGATGYTGRLAAAELVARGARPVLLGRDGAALRTLADDLGGLDWATASADDPGSIAAHLRRGDVLVSTVGPFALHGDAAVQAALDAGAHYLDSTGEPGFARRVFARHAEAEAAGSTVLPALGFDFAPGNLAGALALDRAGPDAVRVDVGYFADGPLRLSGGTIRSLALAMLEPAFELREGGLVERPFGGRLLRHPREHGRPRRSLSGSGSEQLALPESHPRLREVQVGVGFLGPATPTAWALNRAAAPILRSPRATERLRRTIARRLPGSSGGPSDEVNARQRTVVTGHAYDAAGTELARVALRGPSIYGFTQRMLAWAAMELRERPGAPGVHGPVAAFGTVALLDPAAGLGLTEDPRG
jgi:short subunit dehydrogenase-like uncharacterized protein